MKEQIKAIETEIITWHRSNEASRRLETIPGIGPIIASALAATVTDPSVFKSGRQLAAWIGLVPRQSSSGGKERLGHITKQGEPYLRRLLVIGASAVIRFCKIDGSALGGWRMDHGSSRPTPRNGGVGRIGQQDGSDRLGGPEPRKGIRVAHRYSVKPSSIPSSTNG